ncbi:uncharacterized protein B0P05DRAFT_549015 [Gilbertella persicaria]|uniref:uncharacterized protein n=1 Tax=Gilbertella persicaria TaxID=101096 RepID=UPI00221F0E60|nr:uncharacterized protein B0P05DRAFT_549015 [Gilbertella persicaria]KAI8072138.1 hypothetical protein B0P05DRAFT_549015 [Gilbertella persicaria]
MRKMEGNTTSNILSSKEPTLITETTKGIITEKYDKMSNKLKLPSNKYLEDVMKMYSATCSYYHPTHFFVFDADDLIYKTLLTEEDINFIKNLNPITLSKVNNGFEKECKKFKGKKTAIDIIKSCDVTKFDGSTQGYDVYWLNKSMANAMDGFLFVDINDPPSQSEGDLQRNTWSFMKTCFRSIGVSCHSGEVYSSCVAAVESSKRQLDGKSRISKKASKDKPDLLYVKNNVEYAVGEFALTLDSEATKVIRKRGFEAPVMLKMMLDKVVKDYPKVQGSITLVGFVINSKHNLHYP